MSIAECYHIAVQCDGKHEPGMGSRNEFTGDNKRAAHAALRKAGWRLGTNFTAYCPACVRKRNEDAMVMAAMANRNL